MRKIFALLSVVALFALTVTPALAQAQTGGAAAAPAATAPAPATFAPLGMGLTIVGVGLGLGLIGYAALGGIARQPEQAGTIRTAMLIIGGLVEGAGIVSLVLCLVAR